MQETNLFNFGFCDGESSPEIIADAALLQELLKGSLSLAQSDDPTDVFGCSSNKRCFQNAVGNFGAFLMQERQVDVTGVVRSKPGL
jgi:hypothetical protein